MARTKRKRYGHPIVRFFRVVNALICILAVGIAAFGLGGLQSVRAVMPPDADLTQYRPLGTTFIYSTERNRDGTVGHTLLAKIAKEDREPVDLSKVPIHLRQASLAVEDARFYQHRGIDPKGILRAAVANFRSGAIQQGGSTITQQLVKNVWLSQERTIDRKLKELLLALQFERKFSKDEILQMYLNEVYYGHGAYGVQTAAHTFFGKDVSELTLGESALLAGLPRSPTSYSPYEDAGRCKRRRRVVLNEMTRFGMITAERAVEADDEQIKSRLIPLQERGIAALQAPYFTNLLIRELCRDPRYGVDAVYKGGLRIYTTLDIRAQNIAEKRLTEQVISLRKQRRIRATTGQGALALVSVNSGDIVALVGGVGDYKDNQFNRAHPGPPHYGRQPGSSFKPYLFATAFESGYSPNSSFSGSALSWRLGAGRYWTPKNYSPSQGGNYTLRNALAASVNLVAVRVLRKVGIQKAQRYTARILNIPKERIRAVPAMALGSSELSPLEQALGYATFAAGGLRPTMRLYYEIRDYKGDLIERRDPEQVRVISRPAAISLVSCLGSVVSYGTGRRARIPGLQCGGKTGTTSGDRDAWWVGITPDLSCAVWVGNDDNKPMSRAAGGKFSAPVWRDVVRDVTALLGLNGKFPEGAGVRASRQGETAEEEEEEEEEVIEPPTTAGRTITVCTSSGGLATAYCPDTVERSLGPGEPMPGRCRIHGGAAPPDTHSTDEVHDVPDTGGRTVTVTICVDSGMPAGPHCPDTVERSFPASSAPGGRCTIHGGGSSGPGPTPPADPPDEPDTPDVPDTPEPPADIPLDEPGGQPDPITEDAG